MSDPRRPVPQPGILEIALYEGGAGRIDGLDQSVKLSSNENPFGPSERAREAVARAAHQMHRYPPTDHAALREALGRLHGLEPQRIICGVGSDEIIHFLAQAYVGPGDEVIFTEHGFLMYRISTMAAGGVPVAVPERDRTTDVDAILAAVSDRTRLVFVANPNNPTGTMIAPDEIERLADGLPPSTILVIDAAYAEYVEGYDGGASLAATRPNVVMTRTLSKIYGLGGLRVGWAYGPQDIIDVLNRIRGPFNLSSVALAGAEAALADQDHVTRSRTENARLRHWLAAALAEKDVPSDPSHANFVLARFADADTAKACDEALKAEGLIVRRVDGYNLPHCLRITIGDEPACRRVAHVIGRFMAERGRA